MFRTESGGRGRLRGGSGGGGFRGRRDGAGRGVGHTMMSRADLGAIPPVPKTPCDDPRQLPFPRLTAKNDRNTMTLDEELLREIISYFTVRSTGCLNFNDIVEKISGTYPVLYQGVYNNPEHLWAFIRCYNEHFAVDQDPRYPWNVWYLSSSKIVAKSDRRRYDRELAEGNLRQLPDPETVWNQCRYDLKLEGETMTHIFAMFYQARGDRRDGAFPALDILKITALLRDPNGVVSKEIRDYVGGEINDFLCKRNHFVNNFGGHVTVRSENEIAAVRQLTMNLKQNNRECLLRDFFEYFRSNAFGREARAALGLSEHCLFDEFVWMLFQHRLLFRMEPRRGMIFLRHDEVPLINESHIRDVKRYPNLERVLAETVAPGDRDGAGADPDPDPDEPEGLTTLAYGGKGRKDTYAFDDDDYFDDGQPIELESSGGSENGDDQDEYGRLLAAHQQNQLQQAQSMMPTMAANVPANRALVNGGPQQQRLPPQLSVVRNAFMNNIQQTTARTQNNNNHVFTTEQNTAAASNIAGAMAAASATATETVTNRPVGRVPFMRGARPPGMSLRGGGGFRSFPAAPTTTMMMNGHEPGAQPQQNSNNNTNWISGQGQSASAHYHPPPARSVLNEIEDELNDSF